MQEQEKPLRFLHLVLFSKDKKYYTHMANITKTWYARFHDKCKTVYYYRDPDVTEPILEDGVFLRLPGKETYTPGILDKTLQAFEYFFHAEDYDYVIRSNVSSVVNLPHLLNLISNQKGEFFYGGTHVMESDNISGKKLATPLQFAQGTCIVLHRDAIALLLKHQERLNREIEDDPSIALFLRDYAGTDKEKKIRVSPIRKISSSYFYPAQIGAQYASFSTHYNVDNIDVFRNHHVDSDREQDLKHVLKQTLALEDRHTIAKGWLPVRKICYHAKDITDKVRQICAGTKGGVWQVDTSNNGLLDEMFGDPEPGVRKNMQVFFEDESLNMFNQAATLLFHLGQTQHQQNKLFVL